MKIIESKRCILRPVSIDDATDLFEYYSESDILKFVQVNPHRSIGDTKKFINSFFIKNYNKGRIGHFAIVWKENNKVIGNIGFNNIKVGAKVGEMGVCLNREYWKHGIVRELLPHMLRYGFEDINLMQITAIYCDGNQNSAKVLEKSNLSYRGYRVERKKVSGKLIKTKCHIYAIDRDVYFDKYK